MSSVNEKMTAIADAIRSKTGDTDALTLDDMAASITDVYDSGKKNEYDTFWNNFLRNGLNYIPYMFAGPGWNTKNFKPNKDIKPVGTCQAVFRQSNLVDLKTILKNCNVTLDTSECTNFTYFFAYGRIAHLPKISLIKSGNKTDYIFAQNAPSGTTDRSYLISIEELEVSENTVFVSTSFNYCSTLTDLTMTGTLATNGLNLQWATSLSHDSLISILNCLKDYSSLTNSGYYITIGAENIAKLTEEEKLIATNKGWDIR